MTDCVFCDLSRLPKDRRIRMSPRGEAIWVFEPLNPVVPGHLLVVPQTHVEDATTLPFLTAETMHVAAQVASLYESANIITSIGSAATQSVFHLHLHVVPRAEGDGLPLPWTPQQRLEKELDRLDREEALGLNQIRRISDISIPKDSLEAQQPRAIDVARSELMRGYRKGDPGTSSRPVEDLRPPPGGPAPGRGGC